MKKLIIPIYDLQKKLKTWSDIHFFIWQSICITQILDSFVLMSFLVLFSVLLEV